MAGPTSTDDALASQGRPHRCRRAARLAYWASQAASYLPPRGQGLVRFTARRQHATVMKLLAPRGGERILDAGCGTGLLTRALAARGARVWAVDFCPEMLEHVGAAERAICADLETLDLGIQFDAVVCAGALNFVDAERSLERLAAHTRPGGILVISVARASIAGLAYLASRRVLGLPFRFWSARWLTACAARQGLGLVGAENTFPQDQVLAFVRPPSDVGALCDRSEPQTTLSSPG